ncbi:MAG: hypothetical protein ACOYXB_04390 [Bacteroidota bacterium]
MVFFVILPLPPVPLRRGMGVCSIIILLLHAGVSSLSGPFRLSLLSLSTLASAKLQRSGVERDVCLIVSADSFPG